MTGIVLLIVLFLAIALMIIAISKFNIHPFLSLMGTSLILAIVVGLPLRKIPTIIGEGFSSTFASIGIVIILGTLIGLILERTGAVIRIADVIIRYVGERYPQLTIMLMGWVVSIPVFCDSGFIILNPIRKALCHKIQGVSAISMAVALSAGLYTSHVFIPPTPGPIAAANSLGLADHLAFVFLAGVIFSVPTLLAAYIFSTSIDKKIIPIEETRQELPAEKTYEEIIAEYGELPTAKDAFAPIIIPIVLMSLSSVAAMAHLDGFLGTLLNFFGSPLIALSIGVLLAAHMLYSNGGRDEFYDVAEETLRAAGPILFITAAGAVMGKVITEAGFVEFMKWHADLLMSVGILFPYLIAALLKTAQGSSTVAITTTAGIMGMYSDPSSMMSMLGLNSPEAACLAVMAIGAGGMTVSHANDSYFWVVSNFSGLSAQDGYRTQTVMTFIIGAFAELSIFTAALLLL